ncbi:MAG: DUF2878 domain-containing protein, partial [Steroidobacteraceae bacterium]
MSPVSHVIRFGHEAAGTAGAVSRYMSRYRERIALWGNFLGYEFVWFAAVIGAGHGEAWPGVGAALLFATWQLATARERMLDLRLIAAALVLGTCIDGVAEASGLIRYAAAARALPPGGAPLWILALWVALALTLTRSLAWLRGRPLLGVILGAIGAPLSYLGAANGWHALVFARPAWQGLLWLAVTWAAAITTLIGLLTRGLRSSRAVRLPCRGHSP